MNKSILPKDICDYAKSHGWLRIKSKRKKVAIFNHADKQRLEQLIVPLDIGFADYKERVADVVETISKVEKRSILEVENDLLGLEPRAWMVWCPSGHEFEYLVFADFVSAHDQCADFCACDADDMTGEEAYEHFKPIPLYERAQ